MSLDVPAWALFDRVVDGDGDGQAARDDGAYEVNDVWQTELLAVADQGSSAQTIVTDPQLDRGAGTAYAASAPGDFLTYRLPIAEPGTYAIAVRLMQAPQGGQFQLAVADGADGPWKDLGGPQDTYASQATFTSVGPFQAVTFASPARSCCGSPSPGRAPPATDGS